MGDLAVFVGRLRDHGQVLRKNGMLEGQMMLDAADLLVRGQGVWDLEELESSSEDVIELRVGVEETVAEAVARHFGCKLMPWQLAYFNGRRGPTAMR